MALAAVALLVACANGPEAVLIDLPSVSRPLASEQAPAGPSQAVLRVRSLAVPEYMRSRRIRYWAGPETIAQWPNDYWAERIEVAMTRAFVAALRARLPHWTICDAGCGESPPPITLSVDLLRLDYVRRQQEILTTARIVVSAAAPSSPSPRRLEPVLDLSTPVITDSAQGEAQALSVMLEGLAQSAAALAERAHAAATVPADAPGP